MAIAGNHEVIMKQNIYCVEMEVGHMEGSRLPEGCGGAIVNVYLGADSVREAVGLTDQTLMIDRYMPVDTRSVNKIELEEYEGPDEEGYPDKQDLLKLQENGGLWYGPFYLFPDNRESASS